MGKTNQPLTIWVSAAWAGHDKIRELAEKGHIIKWMDDSEAFDLILHPSAHQWHDGLWGHLDVAVKAARGRRYPTKRGKKDDTKAGK